MVARGSQESEPIVEDLQGTFTIEDAGGEEFCLEDLVNQFLSIERFGVAEFLVSSQIEDGLGRHLLQGCEIDSGLGAAAGLRVSSVFVHFLGKGQRLRIPWGGSRAQGNRPGRRGSVLIVTVHEKLNEVRLVQQQAALGERMEQSD